MFAEGIHCVLEIGIYPAMAHQIPNEIIAVVDRMYAGSPFSYLETFGGGLLLLGVLLLGLSILSAAILPRWNAALLLATDLGALLAFTLDTLDGWRTVANCPLSRVRRDWVFFDYGNGWGTGSRSRDCIGSGANLRECMRGQVKGEQYHDQHQR